MHIQYALDGYRQHFKKHPLETPPMTKFVCSNKNCRATHDVDPNGHCPKCKGADGSGWSTIPTDVPRRIRLDLHTPAETAIVEAMLAVEAAGGSLALTDAGTLLSKARDRVADHVEGIG